MAEGPCMVTVQWLDACIYWSLTLPAVHTSTTITVNLCEARLITADTVPPVPKFPPSVCSSPHIAVSPVIQSPSGTLGWTPRPIASSQQPVYYAPNWQPPQKSVYHLHARTSSWDETIVYDHLDQQFFFSGHGQTPTTSKPPLMWLTKVSVVTQSLLMNPCNTIF